MSLSNCYILLKQQLCILTSREKIFLYISKKLFWGTRQRFSVVKFALEFHPFRSVRDKKYLGISPIIFFIYKFHQKKITKKFQNDKLNQNCTLGSHYSNMLDKKGDFFPTLSRAGSTACLSTLWHPHPPHLPSSGSVSYSQSQFPVIWFSFSSALDEEKSPKDPYLFYSYSVLSFTDSQPWSQAVLHFSTHLQGQALKFLVCLPMPNSACLYSPSQLPNTQSSSGAPVFESDCKPFYTVVLLTWRSLTACRAIKENKTKQHNTTGEMGRGEVGQQSFQYEQNNTCFPSPILWNSWIILFFWTMQPQI